MARKTGPKDVTQTALAIVESVIGESLTKPGVPAPRREPPARAEQSKQSKGGKARAAKLSQRKRKAIAKKAAKARWAGK